MKSRDLCFQSNADEKNNWAGSEMRSLRRFVKRLATTAMRRQNEDRLRQEVEQYLALQTADNIQRGPALQEVKGGDIMELEIEKIGVLRNRWHETNRSAGPRCFCGDPRLFSDVQIKLGRFRDPWRSRYFFGPISYT